MDILLEIEAGTQTPNQMGLFIWLTFWTVAGKVSLTFYDVPHKALGAEITRDPHERASLFSFTSFFSFLCIAIVNFVAWFYQNVLVNI